MSNQSNATVATMGIDIGKNSFHVVGLDQRGAIVLRQKWSRGQVEARLANMPPCLIGMEACVGAHHLSRKLQSFGHDARLMPAKYVRPYAKGQKNDFRDGETIAEAVQRPTMKFVATKTAEQLDLQALHRVRERLVSQRTGIINQIRAFLLERGVAVRQGPRFLRTELPNILAKRSDVLSPRMMRIIEELAGDWHRLDERIEGLCHASARTLGVALRRKGRAHLVKDRPRERNKLRVMDGVGVRHLCRSGCLAAVPLACRAEGLARLATQTLGGGLVRARLRDRLLVGGSRLCGVGLGGGGWLRECGGRADHYDERGQHQNS
jgi:hypothetical protein